MNDDAAGTIPSEYPALAATLALAVIPPYLLVGRFGARPGALAAGASAWAVAFALKAAAEPALARTVGNRPVAGASARGVVSAAAELGITQAYVGLQRPPMRPTDAVALAVGAASMEAVTLLAISITAGPRATEQAAGWAAAAGQSRTVRHAMFVERLCAGIGHVASRFSVYQGIRRGRLSVIVVPATLFALVDGVVCYGHTAGWDWLDPTVARRFYGFLAAVSVMDLIHLVAAAKLRPSPVS